jgi:hypothetical protein
MLSSLPGPAVLKDMFEFARRKPGEVGEVSWTADGCTCHLRIYLPVQPMGASRANVTPEIEWTLVTQQSPKSPRQVRWTHAGADCELISNFLLVGHDSQSAPVEPEPGERSPGRVRGAFSSLTGFPVQPQKTVPPPDLLPGTIPESRFPQGGMVLCGDLHEVELNGILQSIFLMRMTGSLEVHFNLDETHLFFEDGVLVHAVCDNTLSGKAAPVMTGEQVLLDLLLWDSGQFRFCAGKKAPARSVERRLDSLLFEGAALQDRLKALTNNGMRLEKPVYRKRAGLRAQEFASIIAEGLPIDPELQEKVYLEINGKKSLQDIVSKFKLQRLQWIPLIFNLSNLDLITFAGTTQQRSESRVPPIPDYVSLTKAKSCLHRMETGMMAYDLFFYFLRLEFERARREQAHVFSVMAFSISGSSDQQPLSVISTGQIAERISSVKDDLDMVAHYREQNYIMLCPCKSGRQSALLAEQVFKSLKKRPLPGMKPDELKMAFGIAGVPQNGMQIEHILSQVEAEKDSAASAGCLFSISTEKAD